MVLTYRWLVAVGLGVVLFLVLGRVQWRRSATAPRLITVQAKDFYFEPHEITFASGNVTVVLANEGHDQHNFVVSGSDNRDLDGIPSVEEFVLPGNSATKTLTLAPGNYAFYCRGANHYQLGMGGTLVVR